MLRSIQEWLTGNLHYTTTYLTITYPDLNTIKRGLRAGLFVLCTV